MKITKKKKGNKEYFYLKKSSREGNKVITKEKYLGKEIPKNIEEIKKNGYVLTPGRYVGLADTEDDLISFEEKMSKLSTNLRNAFSKGRELENKIDKNLKELGF